MKNAFKCLIIVDITEETFIELYDNSIETSHTKMKRVRNQKKKVQIETWDISKSNIVYQEYQKEDKENTEQKNIWSNNGQIISKINRKHKIIDPGITYDKYKTNNNYN